MPYSNRGLNLYNLARPATIFSITYVGVLTITATTNSGSFDIGPADDLKEIFIVSSAYDASSTRTLDAPTTTVDGVVVTKESGETTTTNGLTLACARVQVPTQSGAVTIQVGFSASAKPMDGGRAAIYKVLARPGIGLGNDDTSSTTSGQQLTSSSVSGTTVQANGFILGSHQHVDAGGLSTPPALLIEDVDVTDSFANYSLNHSEIQSAGSTPTTTWSWSTGAKAASATWAFS